MTSVVPVKVERITNEHRHVSVMQKVAIVANLPESHVLCIPNRAISIRRNLAVYCANSSRGCRTSIVVERDIGHRNIEVQIRAFDARRELSVEA